MNNIEAKYLDLIQADIDDVLSPEEEHELDVYLADNPVARDFRDELTGFCGRLNTVELLDPPPFLRQQILQNLKPRKAPRANTSQQLRGILHLLFGVSTLRYAASFAAGALLSYTFISSDQLSKRAFDDITSLVGTMTQPQHTATLTSVDHIQLTRNEIAGTVRLSQAGSVLVIDFDLVAIDPVEVVAGFADPDIWFNGFAQAEQRAGTVISADAGQVTLHMDGQGRYAVYLYNAGQNGATVMLKFYSSGNMIYEDELSFGDEK
jgi:hypothetical protein